jgi:hypothetical protein
VPLLTMLIIRAFYTSTLATTLTGSIIPFDPHRTGAASVDATKRDRLDRSTKSRNPRWTGTLGSTHSHVNSGIQRTALC